MKAQKVYLVGFMASGKTTLARRLAKRLDWQAVDIDDLVETREHLSVAEIFARRRSARQHCMFTATGLQLIWVHADSICTASAVVFPPSPCGPMPV